MLVPAALAAPGEGLTVDPFEQPDEETNLLGDESYRADFEPDDEPHYEREDESDGND